MGGETYVRQRENKLVSLSYVFGCLFCIVYKNPSRTYRNSFSPGERHPCIVLFLPLSLSALEHAGRGLVGS